MSKYTDEELAGLTDEERAALEELSEEEASTDEEEGDAASDAAGNEGADDSAEADDGDDGGKGDEAEGGDDGEDLQEAGEEDDEGEEEAVKADPPAPPLLTAQAPDDADEQLQAIATQKDELVAKFDDGELTAKEYQQELDKLARQEREIEQAQFKAQLAQEMSEQQQRNAWLATVNAFLDENPAYRQNPLMYKTLDLSVRELAAQEENQGLSGQEILAKAHAQITEQFGLAAPKAEDKGKPKKSRKPINAPPSLAHVPAATATEMEDGRWGKLDRMMESDPEGYEAALAKMSDADRDAYLSSH